MRSLVVERAPVRTLLVIGILAFAVAGYASTRIAGSGPLFNGTTYPDAPDAPEFELTAHTGESTSLRVQRGRVVLLFFGFTRCPDICPLTLSKLSRLLADSGIDPDRARILLITVDPENDSPEELARYVKPFGDAVLGLTGPLEEIRGVQADYGVFAEQRPDHSGHPTLAHTTVVFGIDAAGRLRVILHPEEPDDIVLEDIRTLLEL